MITLQRPMLAASLLPSNVEHTDGNIFEAMKKLKYPVLASLKKDGIRALKTNDLVSRTLRMIPNESIRRRAMKLPAGFDMELFNPDLPYDKIESIVMSEEHPDSSLIEFHILDNFNHEGNYKSRCESTWNYWVCITMNKDNKGDIYPALPFTMKNATDLFTFFLNTEKEQGEGICFRLLNSPYKQGRSTLKEQYLVKLARFIRTECIIIGFEEQLLNYNTKKRNAIGMMDRSSQKAGMLGKNTLGSLLVRSTNGIEFSVGTGFSDTLRKQIWDYKEDWIGKTIVVKSKPHGQKIKPRCPTYCGLRNEIDIL